MSTAIVTGATAGIGAQVALALGSRGHDVWVLGRSRDRGSQIVQRIRTGGGSAQFVAVDLADFGSIRSAAAELDGEAALDVMVNNAGVGRGHGLTSDGFEIHFGVNHLGHFLLNALLRSRFREGTRVVNVTSSVHKRAEGIDFDAVRRPARSWWGLDEYGVSKLANILYTKELGQRDPRLRTYAVHPGLTDTAILPWPVRVLQRRKMRTAAEAAADIVRCAVDPDLGSETRGYYTRHGRSEPSESARSEDLAVELWRRSESWCGSAPAP